MSSKHQFTGSGEIEMGEATVRHKQLQLRCRSFLTSRFVIDINMTPWQCRGNADVVCSFVNFYLPIFVTFSFRKLINKSAISCTNIYFFLNKFNISFKNRKKNECQQLNKCFMMWSCKMIVCEVISSLITPFQINF